MKYVVIRVGCPLLPPDGGELLDEEGVVLTIGWVTASCIGCESTPLGGVQVAVNVVTCGSPVHWLFCLDSCGLGIIVFLDLRIICQV